MLNLKRALSTFPHLIKYYNNAGKISIRCVGTTYQDSSAQSQVQETEEKYTSPLSEIKKKPQRLPFIKELFLGRFDTDKLAYPEVLDRERHNMLHEMVEPIEKFFDTEVDSSKIDKEAKIPDEVLRGLKDLGLFGIQIPEELGGLGLGATEFARIAEILSRDGGIAVTLSAHQAIGLKGIILNGTKEQKEKYLPRLATGELIAAFCLTEPSSGSDAASVQTRATISDDGKHYLLNGNKIWISNGGRADILTVFAKTEVKDHLDEPTDKVTAFIVERNFGGVTSSKPEDKLGIRGSDTCEIYFDNTPVPISNVLGEVGDGFKVAVNILNSGRFSMGSAGAGILKRIMNDAIDHAINRKQFGLPLKDFALIQEKFVGMTLSIYAMESMAYLTAGIIDGQERADCSLEAAIVKVFSSEACWKWISECLQILGGLGYMKSYPFERYLRDSRIMLIFEGTNEILRIFIALSGLQYAGKELADMVKKLRNPFMNPGYVMKTVSEHMFSSLNKPRLNLNLNGFLHPTLKPSADELERSVKRFGSAVQSVLRRHGAKVVEPKNQMELARLADCAIDLYAMTAVLSRSSRAYCIGLRNADLEINLAHEFCADAADRIKARVFELQQAPLVIRDENYRNIAKKLIENKGYAPVHPLAKTYW